MGRRHDDWTDPEVQEVVPGVHRAPVPLPHDGLRAVNVYVVEEPDGVTLVDAGCDSPIARQAVEAGLAAAGAGIGDIRQVLVTHVHHDHVGQATELVRAGAGGFWLGEGDEGTFRHMTTDPAASRRTRLAELVAHGADALVEEARDRRGLDTTRFDLDEPDRWAVDGDAWPLRDGRELEAVATPGHTAGHLCYLDRDRRLLFAGDHVLPHITPSIGLEGVTNPAALIDFLASLARVRALEVDLVLPAHGPPFPDLAGRVDELVAHHDDRLDACARALPDAGSTSAAAVAAALPWTRRATPFAALDLFNRLLATWETIAHLELLAARGDAVRLEVGGGQAGRGPAGAGAGAIRFGRPDRPAGG